MSNASARVVPVLAAMVVLTILLAGAPARAQSGFEAMELELADLAYVGVVVPIGQMMAYTEPARPDRATQINEVDLWVNRQLVWNHPQTAETLSDVFVVTLNAAMIVAPFVGNLDFSEESWNGAIVGLEAYTTVTLLTELSKHVIARERPDGVEDDRYASYISGHASHAFASATMLTVFAYEYEWLDERVRWLIPTIAFTLAATTGYLRMAGDRHWLTDVVGGATVGMGAAYLVYRVRVR